MAVLTDPDRFAVWRDFMQENTAPFGALTKHDLRNAVNAIDQWLQDNAAALNAAIPQPARAQLTTVQKSQLLTAVVRKRYLSGA
jgi:hypothetical protein